jgi:hypothetical protein
MFRYTDGPAITRVVNLVKEQKYRHVQTCVTTAALWEQRMVLIYEQECVQCAVRTVYMYSSQQCLSATG